MTTTDQVGAGIDVEASLRLLLDERDIRNVIIRYVHACDRLDSEELATIYHPGAYDDHGPLRGDEADYRRDVIDILRDAFTLCWHTLGQTNFVEYTGDTARTETYVFAVTGRLVDGKEYLWTNGGRYIDRFDKRDGEWRIADRAWVYEWDQKVECDRWMTPTEWIPGVRDRTDASYFAAPLERR